jgi:hypothetical protein
MSGVLEKQAAQMICPATDQIVGQNRATLASEIGANVADLGRRLAELPQGDTYRVVLSQPFGGGLNPRPDGLYDAFVIGRTGKITAVARLERMGPRFLTSATMLAGHAMLAQISSQIAALQVDVDLLLRLQVSGELGKVKAAMNSLRTLHHYGTHRDEVLLSTIALLKEAIGIAIEQAAQLIRAVPEPPSRDILRAVWDTSPETVKALGRAREAVIIVLFGLQALGEAEVLLNENVAAAQIMRIWIENARRDLDLARSENLARMMPAKSEADRHETFWMKAAASLQNSQTYIDGLISGEVGLRIAFECKADDLLAVDNGKLQESTKHD